MKTINTNTFFDRASFMLRYIMTAIFGARLESTFLAWSGSFVKRRRSLQQDTVVTQRLMATRLAGGAGGGVSSVFLRDVQVNSNLIPQEGIREWQSPKTEHRRWFSSRAKVQAADSAAHSGREAWQGTRTTCFMRTHFMTDGHPLLHHGRLSLPPPTPTRLSGAAPAEPARKQKQPAFTARTTRPRHSRVI